MDESDFYSQVPKGLAENLQYRLDIRKRAQHDKGFRRALMTACKHDVLYFLNCMCFLYEPRPKIIDGKRMPNVIPFITWEHQDPVVLKIRENLGLVDIGCEKSRAEGASWIAVLLALQDWLFEDLTTIGIVSRNELAVDNPIDPGSLFWKSLAVGTPVLTPKGWKPIEKISEGDLVIGSSGKPICVLKSLPKYKADIFRVTFSDGVTIDCTEDHLWAVSSCKDRMHGRRDGTYHKYNLKTTKEIAATLRPANGLAKHWSWQAQELSCVQFPWTRLSIPPYVLGVLLGDGCLCKDSVEFASADDEIVECVRNELDNSFRVRKTGEMSWIISQGNSGGRKKNLLSVNLKGLGLRGKRAWEKYIPACYLWSSKKQRIALLQGLMDTDGTVAKKPGFAYFSTTSERLAKDMRCLVQSLGGVSGIKSYKRQFPYKGEKRNGRKEFRVWVHFKDIMPFRLSRKAAICRNRKHTTGRRIVAVEPLGRGQAKCISVEALDGLFVVDGFLLTHNCDWSLTKLPEWMVPPFDRNISKHTLHNLSNGSVITGYAATGDVASGGRCKWFFFDELAKFPRGPERTDEKALTSVQQVTNSRLVISTPLGTDGAYYDIMHTPSNMVKVVLDWKDNQTKNRGLYEMNKGKPVAVDPVNNPLPKNYAEKSKMLFARLRSKGFKLDKCLRSPWYDNECDRMGATPQNIAQELDRDYGGSVFKTFVTDFFDRARPTVRAPFIRGNLTYHPETLVPDFGEVENGPLLLWTTVDTRRKPPSHVFALGIDVSTGGGGTYTSNSAVEVIDLTTMEQVAEFADNVIAPSDFADFCIALAKWFNNAYMTFETNGPGIPFAKQILKRQYENIYYRTAFLKRSKKKTKVAGWHTDDTTKRIMFEDLSRSVRISELTLRSNELVQECAQYEWVNGKIQHVLVKSADGASAGEAHGDRVIAMGVCLQAVQDRPLPKTNAEEEIRPDPPRDSMAYRLLEYEKERKKKLDRWDSRTLWDMAHPA